jgi:hypothetical protein
MRRVRFIMERMPASSHPQGSRRRPGALPMRSRCGCSVILTSKILRASSRLRCHREGLRRPSSGGYACALAGGRCAPALGPNAGSLYQPVP